MIDGTGWDATYKNTTGNKVTYSTRRIVCWIEFDGDIVGMVATSRGGAPDTAAGDS